MNVNVIELTWYMQLTKSEIMETQMLVTRPEKWDLVTKKVTGDSYNFPIILVLVMVVVDISS